MTDMDEQLISWYLENKRNLPWRETQDPYFIWLSEIILQQTRVDQGLEYYFKFAEAYPSIGMLASASEDEVLKLWQGLGYYSRARNLRAAAIQVNEKFGGVFPNTYKEVLSLKGVGPYTAAAIMSFAFKQRYAVVDGNVNRVLARVFDLSFAVDSSSGKKEIQRIADDIISHTHPDLFNQAIMELGAMVCTPSSPNCMSCPWAEHCLSRQNGTSLERPVKLPKRKAKKRIMNYVVLDDGESYIFKQRKGSDIWQGLWDFPIISEDKPTKETLGAFLAEEFPGIGISNLSSKPTHFFKHILTHQQLHAYFWLCETDSNILDNSLYLRVPKAEVEALAVPRLINKFLSAASIIPE